MKQGSFIYGPRLYKARLGREGGDERVILLTQPGGFYLAVHAFGKYNRLAIWQYGLRWHASRG